MDYWCLDWIIIHVYGIFIQFLKILYLTYGLLVFGLDYHLRLRNIYSILQDIIFNVRIIVDSIVIL